MNQDLKLEGVLRLFLKGVCRFFSFDCSNETNNAVMKVNFMIYQSF